MSNTDTVVYVVGLTISVIGTVATAIGAVATGRAASKEEPGSDARGSLRFAQIILWSLFAILLMFSIVLLLVLIGRARTRLSPALAEAQRQFMAEAR